jgi:hypothetical protein
MLLSATDCWRVSGNGLWHRRYRNRAVEPFVGPRRNLALGSIPCVNRIDPLKQSNLAMAVPNGSVPGKIIAAMQRGTSK